jgi:hypothetical protein
MDMLHILYRLYIDLLPPKLGLFQSKPTFAKIKPEAERANSSIIDSINYIDNKYMNSQLLQLLKVI